MANLIYKILHEGMKQYKCEICDIRFALSKELYQHNKANHKKEKELLTCEICGRKFKWEYKLTEHRFIHGLKDATIDEDNLSEFCKDPKVVNLLDRRQKNNVKKNFHCKICDKEVFFGRIAHIQKYHFEPEGLKCPKCDKAFSRFSLGWFVLVAVLIFFLIIKSGLKK